MQAVIDHIYNIYEPLKQVLQIHGTLKAEIIIIPIVISKTGTFNVRTLAKIAQLVSFREEPSDTLTYKQLPNQHKKMQWRYTSTHKNGSHISPKSQEKASSRKQRPNLHRKKHLAVTHLTKNIHLLAAGSGEG
jgi:hypothetical protein